TSDYFYFVTEYVRGRNLMQHIQEDGWLAEEKTKKIFGQIVGAIKYCHDRGIMHRDLKPQNIVIDEQGNAKVIGFGLGIKCKAGTKLYKRYGTYSYNAPELFLGEGYDGKKTDVWSLGVILYFMTTGHLPFVGNTLEELQANILTGAYKVPSHVSTQLENLIHQLLTVIPGKRPTLKDIQKHPWVITREEYPKSILKPETGLDPIILGVLRYHGYDPHQVRKSMKNKNFDDHMAAYLLLKEQARLGLGIGYGIPVKPVDPGPAPPPSPANPFIFFAPIRRT
ncbi:putative sperm motility kinase W, partial [Nannospalax galili]|uniref:putative sperm motility kinase W n=1 Tax=Nannospalax galili TaxID=1026970 RepID=UPI000819B899